MGHGWGKLTQFLVEDEDLVLVMFSHPGSVHPVNHLRVGVAHLLRDEVWVSTVSQRLTCIRVSGLVCSAITNPVASHYCLLRRVERPDCVMLPSMGNHCSRFKDYILPGQRNKLAGDIYFLYLARRGIRVLGCFFLSFSTHWSKAMWLYIHSLFSFCELFGDRWKSPSQRVSFFYEPALSF
ncbi:Uncharacterised protein [Enterobacter asburiae]|uniref:Uncharacterized protein n=1 Tax=Enterobacter asburiae TaxID=61645 RepID=A0A376FMX0_ENTAS|nr:Uncharacterised protein [Enterobacter asburiae]